ncbi:MAG TPA: ATP-binding cassette domain-containing protein [Oscillatoriales cyanobacterium M59_W2019_021]|nr:MAG: ATP-binding cassette domain-containing protein [Cyanobacteria bacterium J055]HIK33554.1 ATP-binding cassette domain-containing protein [Oscillatoriales cyanobacterium M4454_W2019_049]HIK53188.1 ATP-binding cassette domain-containing protein [Oscillatoriales cyanobacterium M59_W2019_021]
MQTLNTTPTNLIATEAPKCTPFLQIKGLSKVYPTPKGPYPVLNDVNLTVCEGEFICVIGHSGCGKSTLLNMVSGFNQPTEGEVLLENNPIVEPGPDRMVVFQNYALLPWKTAYENVYLGVNTVYPSLPEAEKKQIAQSYLDMVGLTEAANKRPTELSGGMKQRVSIARALALHPKVLILDEPFGALDPITREELQDELLKIWRDRQVTVLMITHDIDEALYLADRLVMMTNGPSATIGEILEIPFPRPRDRARVMEDPRYYELRNEALDFLYHRFAHSEDDEVSAVSTETLKTQPKTPSTQPKKITYPLGAKVAAGVGLALAVAGAILGGYNAATGKLNPPEEEATAVVETPTTAAPSPTAVKPAEAKEKTTTTATATPATAEAKITTSATSTPTATPATADSKPETSATAAKPEVAAEITDPTQLENLKWDLYDFLDNEWRTTPTYSEDLTYTVKVAEDGTIASYEPLNAAAKEFVKEIPLSAVKNTPAQKAAEFKVIFSPTGILDVQLAE